MSDQQFLVISLAVTVPRDLHHRLVAAAAKAGIPYVMPNYWGSDFTNDSLASENLHVDGGKAMFRDMDEQGVAWIPLVCSFWYEFSLTMGPDCFGFDFSNKKITFFGDGKTRINTSTWTQCGLAVARLLSLKEIPEDENDRSPTVSQWKRKPLYISSFLVSQRDMLDSVNRVMGTTDNDWTIEYEPAKERYERGLELLRSGDRAGFGIALYTRTFFPNGGGDYESTKGLANEALGLPKEDIDEVTKAAIETIEGN